MIVVREPAALRDWTRARRAAGKRLGFVPTMGALHEGHLRLVDRAVARTDEVVASVFVNPLQFGPGEDLAAYPRDEIRDQSLLRDRGVAAVFMPTAEAMYPEAPAVRLVAPELTGVLCGPHRPGHFEGVLMAVAKLLNMCEPDVAVFGRKDAQQAVLIRRLAEDLDFAVHIEVAPIVRESDGLAMSSRNAYIGAEHRQAATVLSRALEAGHRAWRDGAREARAIQRAVGDLLATEPAFRAQYVELVETRALQPVANPDGDALLAIAGFIGATRLIDNVVLGQGLAGDVFVE